MATARSSVVRLVLTVLVAVVAVTAAFAEPAFGGFAGTPCGRPDDTPPDIAGFLKAQVEAGAQLTPAGRGLLAMGIFDTARVRSIVAGEGTTGFTKLVVRGKPNVGSEFLTPGSSARPGSGAETVPAFPRAANRGPQTRSRAAGYGWADYFCYFGQAAWVTWWTGGGATNPKWYERDYFGGSRTIDQPSKYCPPSEAPCYWIGVDDPPSTWKVTAVSIWAQSGPTITGSWCS